MDIELTGREVGVVADRIRGRRGRGMIERPNTRDDKMPCTGTKIDLENISAIRIANAAT